jgi:C4-dicarboxylate-specific signal transduction histidine kinase
LITQLLPLVQPAARHTSVGLSAELAAEPLLVRGDRDALEQLVLNLLWNAMEAAGRIRGPAEASAPTVTIRLGSTPPGRITLEVTDTGPGPEPDVATRMFEPFVTGKPDGVGLGLAVAQEVVARHAGTLTWQRHDNRTAFTVQLPRAPGST